MEPINIPASQRTIPWVQSLVNLIQEQAKIIQTQAEKIAQLEKNGQTMRDEIARLKKTPKRPKFRPGGGASSKDKEKSTPTNEKAFNDPQNTPIQKQKEEIVVQPLVIPTGSRFKGYSTYSIQELVLTPKEIV